MRVLQIGADPLTTPRQPHGAIFELDQARALATRGHEVRLVSTGEIPRRFLGKSYPYPLLASEGNLTVYRKYHRFLSRRGDSLVLTRTISDGVQLAESVRNSGFNADIVHGHNLGGALIGAEVARRLGVPLVTTEHRTAWLNPLFVAPLAAEWRAKLLETSRVACVGEALQSAYSTALPEMAGRVRLIPNLVDDRFFGNARANQTARDRTELLMVGYLVEHKGHDKALRAFAQVYRGRPNARMTIVGDGPERRRLRRLARDLHIHGQVTWTGPQSREQVLSIMRDSTALLVASTVETFSVAAIEALASGVPVVATRCGGPEFFVTEHDGVLARGHDSFAIADALESFEARRSDFDAQSISASCRARFSGEAVAAQIEAMWREALGGTSD